MGNKLPADFLERISRTIGEEFQAFCSSLHTESAVSIRKHPTKYYDGFPLEINSNVPWCASGAYLMKRPRFHLDPLWHAGAYYVQEASSMYLEQALKIMDLPPNAIALDVCAAPGGKSTHLLGLLPQQSLLVSNELIPKRNLILRENLDRWGFPNTISTQSKTTNFRNLPNFFDLIIVDAPCSGEGLFRKDPKAVQQWSSAHVAACSKRQQLILDDIAPAIRPGGYLMYSTCTYSEAENEDRIKDLLESGVWEHLELPIGPFEGIQRGCNNLGVRFYPHKIQGEGFFMACLRKKGGSSTTTGHPGRNTETNCPKILLKWLDVEGLHFSEWNKTGYVFPAEHLRSFEELRRVLRITGYGTEVGKFIHKELKPSHSLALSVKVSRDIPGISLTLDDAVKYLKKETIPHNIDYSPGWNLIQYQGVNLGWGKVLDRRINNYYPKSLSIRP
ncbi:MAG: hypothetical protein GY751_14855 [Bacteroidetes bacterium]|nr:hypothetical protein [Bacteroidota bacterium]